MQVISQRQLANKNLTDHPFLILDKTHIQGAEPVFVDQISRDLTAAQITQVPTQATSYSLEARTSKTKETKFNSIINRWTLKIKMHLKSKWLLHQATRFISK